MTVQIYNNDCLKQIPKIKKTIDLVLVDLPYGQTACAWDSVIDLKQMWIELKKKCKRDCVYVFFCTTKFGYKLIQSNEKWFRYDLVWEKSRKVGFLSANKMPLRQHEMVYVFSDTNSDDLDNSRNLGLREYFKQVMVYVDKTLKEITKDCGRCAEHCFYFNSTQFGLPTEKTYNKLIEAYSIDKMEGFRTIEDLQKEWKAIPETTYNPQKTEGKPYKTNGGGIYEHSTCERIPCENKGDRHPTSILHIPEEPREHEMVYVFSDDYNETSGVDLDNTLNLGLREYAKLIKQFINKPVKDITAIIGDMGIQHFYSFNSTQFRLPALRTYNILIDVYGIDKMEGFRTFEDLRKEWIFPIKPKPQTTYNSQKTEGKAYKTNGGGIYEHSTRGRIPCENKGDRHPTSILHIPEEPREHEMVYVFKETQGTYNPQKTEGKPYKIKGGGEIENNIYRETENYFNRSTIENKGDRHPTTIVKFNNPTKSLHRTQKPTDLCEWLIKSYSNEGDTVLDFTMGSGSTGVACIITGRNFIGIEQDAAIFKIARDRLLKHEITSKH
jgi:DNA modification methylase